MGLPSPQQVSNYEEVLKLHIQYTEVEDTPGWRDFMGRISKMRTDMTKEILQGTVDKYGESRDAEKRAALMVLDRFIMLAPMIHKQHEHLEKKLDEMKNKANKRGENIHGEDMFTAASNSAVSR